MKEIRVHVVITDVPKSDQRHESSVVKVPSGAGQARFRAAALSQRCSFVHWATLRPVCGLKWLPNPCKMGEGQVRRLDLSSAHGSHRSRGGGTESNPGRVNWGTSARQRSRWHKTKKLAVAGRSSDVVIVSDEADGQYNRWRSQGPLGRCVVSDTVSAAGRKSDYGTKRARERKPLWQRQNRPAVMKGASDSLLGAVLGKTHRTES
jgi:hypothetical protein